MSIFISKKIDKMPTYNQLNIFLNIYGWKLNEELSSGQGKVFINSTINNFIITILNNESSPYYELFIGNLIDDLTDILNFKDGYELYETLMGFSA